MNTIKVKKVLKNFDKKDEFYYWFRVKKEAQIIIKDQGYEDGIDYYKCTSLARLTTQI